MTLTRLKISAVRRYYLPYQRLMGNYGHWSVVSRQRAEAYGSCYLTPYGYAQTLRGKKLIGATSSKINGFRGHCRKVLNWENYPAKFTFLPTEANWLFFFSTHNEYVLSITKSNNIYDFFCHVVYNRIRQINYFKISNLENWSSSLLFIYMYCSTSHTLLHCFFCM